MLSVIPKPNPKPDDIKLLKSYSDASVSEIKRAAESGSSIRDFRIFEGDWESERCVIARLYREFAGNSSVPFLLREDGELFETPESFRERLEGLRQTELQTQRDTDLEMGFIQTPEEFKPHDEEWF
jgi:hypothetical protein